MYETRERPLLGKIKLFETSLLNGGAKKKTKIKGKKVIIKTIKKRQTGFNIDDILRLIREIRPPRRPYQRKPKEEKKAEQKEQKSSFGAVPTTNAPLGSEMKYPPSAQYLPYGITSFGVNKEIEASRKAEREYLSKIAENQALIISAMELAKERQVQQMDAIDRKNFIQRQIDTDLSKGIQLTPSFKKEYIDKAKEIGLTGEDLSFDFKENNQEDEKNAEQVQGENEREGLNWEEDLRTPPPVPSRPESQADYQPPTLPPTPSQATPSSELKEAEVKATFDRKRQDVLNELEELTGLDENEINALIPTQDLFQALEELKAYQPDLISRIRVFDPIKTSLAKDPLYKQTIKQLDDEYRKLLEAYIKDIEKDVKPSYVKMRDYDPTKYKNSEDPIYITSHQYTEEYIVELLTEGLSIDYIPNTSVEDRINIFKRLLPLAEKVLTLQLTQDQRNRLQQAIYKAQSKITQYDAVQIPKEAQEKKKKAEEEKQKVSGDLSGLSGRKYTVNKIKIEDMATPQFRSGWSSVRGLLGKIKALRQAYGQDGGYNKGGVMTQLEYLINQIPNVNARKITPEFLEQLLLDINAVDLPEEIEPVAKKYYPLLTALKGKGRDSNIYVPEDQLPDGTDVPALYDFEIERYMFPYIPKGWLGCLCWDEIPQLSQYLDNDRMAFIINTLGSKDDLTEEGHWVACFIDFVNRKEIGFFDPTGETPDANIMGSIFKLLNKKNGLTENLKVKYNIVPRQMYGTSSCGIHCMEWLKDMFSGKPFREASGFDKLAEQYKDDPKEFLEESEEQAKDFYEKNKAVLHRSRLQSKFPYLRLAKEV